MAARKTEGYISFKGYRTWYRVVGDLANLAPGKLPLLTLHGGPGACHDYLESLTDLAETGRPVIFYDQLGCGYSDRPDNPAMWTVDLFLEEVDAIRAALGLEHIHLLGQSWGGMLGMEYMVRKPKGVASFVIASSPADMKLWVSEANRLRDELPAEIQATLLKHEADGTTSDPAYQEAMVEFYNRHVCRVVPWPDYVVNSFAKLGEQVYNTMNGPSEFHVIGTLKDWTIMPRIGAIEGPVLVTSGKYDECTPMQAKLVVDAIKGAEWALFDNSSHMPHAEEPEKYLQVLDSFFSRVEAKG